MTTSRTPGFVSLVTTIAAVALSACAGAAALEGWAPAEARPVTIRFDNDGREHVHVYLVGDRREWLLGRVEPGAIAALRIPSAALTEPGLMRLVVIAGWRPTVAPARDPRAQVTMALPASHILTRKWWFAQGQVASLGLPVSGAAVRRY